MIGSRDETGSALVEAIILVVVLIMPIVWFVGALGQIHRAGLAASAAAREAAVASARSTDEAGALRAARAAVVAAFVDHGLSPDRARMETGDRSALVRGREVRVRVSYPVDVGRLPFVDRNPRVWVRATHVAEVDLYRSRDAGG